VTFKIIPSELLHDLGFVSKDENEKDAKLQEMGYDGGVVSNLSAIILGLAGVTLGFLLVGSYKLFHHCLPREKQEEAKRKMKSLFGKCVHMIHETFNNASIPIMVTSWISIKDEGLKKKED